MKKIILTFILVLMLLVLAGSLADSLPKLRNMAAVITSNQSGIFSECIASFSDLQAENFAVTFTYLNDDRIEDGIIRYTQSEKCGSAGCIHEICLSNDKGEYVHVPFGFAAEFITVKETTSNGLKDLLLNNHNNLQMRWNGLSYAPSTD